MPLRLIHCTWASGIGGGVPRMDALFWQLLNRDKVLPRFVYVGDEKDITQRYDKDMELEATGTANRFGRLLELFADADIVQFQGGFDPLVCEAARISGVPVLVEILHNIEPGGAFPNITATVCVSDAVRAVQPRGLPSITIHNGIELRSFPFQPKSRDVKFVILQVGAREKSDLNLDALAPELLAIDPAIELWICGRGQHGKSTDRVKFLGLVKDVALLYRQADLFVQLSRAEPFGLVALEALASGCVPLLSASGAFPEIVEDRVTGFLVPPGSKEKVVERVREAFSLRSSPEWESLQARGRKRVEERFTAERCIATYTMLYEKLITDKGQRRSRGPVNIAATPDAELGDAMFNSHAGKWDLVEQSLARLAAHPAPMSNPACKANLTLFIELMRAKGREQLAGELIKKAR